MTTKLVSVRIEEELLEWLKEKAKSEHRTSSNMINTILLKEKEHRTGKWLFMGTQDEWYGDEYKCPFCGDKMIEKSNFCPNCGARLH